MSRRHPEAVNDRFDTIVARVPVHVGAKARAQAARRGLSLSQYVAFALESVPAEQAELFDPSKPKGTP